MLYIEGNRKSKIRLGFTFEYSGLKRPDCRGSSTIVPQQ